MDDSVAPSSLPSIWASMNSWFTPTVLFVFLNLMIATILFTSNNTTKQDHKEEKTQNQNQNQNDLIQSNKLTRSPSILHRLRSFNFHPHRSQQDSSSSSSSSSSFPPTHQNQNQQQIQESLEIAATQYVFNHPFSHQNDSTNPNNPDLNLDPTRFESFQPESENKDDQFAAFNHTNEVLLANSKTHFVFENNHTIEKVTTHFDFGSENPDKDPGFEEMLTHEEEEEENDQFQSLDEVYSVITGGGHVNRTKSDTLPASGELPVKLPAKMKKSASLKSAFNHFEEEKIVEARRPATVRERRSAARAAAEEDDVEVDAKADDFINKFKHQLKLQRLDSIIRYKDMVNRGGGK